MTSSGQQQWKEKEWESYVNELLSTHHSILGESFQPVPDFGGDRGLEGFTNKGEAYQSYADQDSKNNEERTRKQKKKILDDLKKLEKYSEFWEEMLGDIKLTHWTLMVPSLDDKEVVKYAKTKARQLVKKNLSFIDKTFFADVKSANGFPVAQAALKSTALPRLSGGEIEDDAIQAFLDSETEFVGKLKSKLANAFPDAGTELLDANVKHWLRWHLECGNILDNLESYPSLWESLDELIYLTGKSIETENLFNLQTPPERLRETRVEFEVKLTGDGMGFLNTSDSIAVSNGVVAKWLGECPLDFPGVGDVQSDV